VRWRLWQYVAVFAVCHTSIVACRVYEFFQPDAPSYTLTLCMCIFSPLSGALNALCYGLNAQVRSEFHTLMCAEVSVDAVELVE
jgi:hypothetical protein